MNPATPTPPSNPGHAAAAREALGWLHTARFMTTAAQLDQLPPLSELKDFGELDPQLSFTDPDAPKPAAIVAGINDDAEPDDADLVDTDLVDTDLDDAGHDEDANVHDAENGSDHDLTDDGDDAGTAHATHDDDAIPASEDTHTALVADDDSTGA